MAVFILSVRLYHQSLDGFNMIMVESLLLVDVARHRDFEAEQSFCATK